MLLALLIAAAMVPSTAAAESPLERPRAVVAIIGEGTNPYHEDFREPEQTAHPSSYLEGYPAEAKPLNVSFGADYETALAADTPTWESYERDTLYYVPGTNVIGMITFGGGNALDEGGHGTGTSSLATGNIHGMAPDADVVMVNGDLFAAIEWAAKQPWIDALSISFGGFLGTCTLGETCHREVAEVCTGNPMLPVHWVRDMRKAYERGAQTFAAASYGCGFSLASGTFSHAWPGNTFTSFFSGPSWTMTVGTLDPRTGQSEFEGAYPVEVVSPMFGYKAAAQKSVNGENEFGNASGAVPKAAGVYAAIVLRARQLLGDTSTVHAGRVLAAAPPGRPRPLTGPLADGVFTQAEAEAAYFHTAKPIDVVTAYGEHGDDIEAWLADLMPAPPQAEFVTQGYGLVDGKSLQNAYRVLDGSLPEPARLKEDAWHIGISGVRDGIWLPIDELGLYVI
jgi:hypothetical protein